MCYRLSKIVAHLGVVIGIWVVALIANKETVMLQSFRASYNHDRDLNLTECMGLGLFLSLWNLIPIYICFRLDKSLGSHEGSGLTQFSSVRNIRALFI